MKTIIEPFRIKSVEPIRLTTRQQRQQLLADAHYNPFSLQADHVLIDLLTDSGTSAMSSRQWAGMMIGDESYAGGSSFLRFEQTVRELTGMTHILPTHQGRAAERILFRFLSAPGKVVISNTLFDTTRANAESSGAEGLDLLIPEGKQPAVHHPFKGNLDVTALSEVIRERGAEAIALVMLTITNNSGGGQPVSMENARQVSAMCRQHQIPFFIDACRFAENAMFIQQREPGYADKSPTQIAREMFRLADGATMSAKKDAFANIGGFLALNDDGLAQRCREELIITEGFPTYGGLAGRDLEAIATGLEEVLDADYLHYRLRSVAYLGEKLSAAGIPLVMPTGGHAVYLDARAFLAHIPVEQYPGQALVCALYETGGIRACEIGSVMFGKYDAAGQLIPAPLDLVRLAIPRRVYTQSHIDYVAEVIEEVYTNREALFGFEITHETPMLRHFTAQFKPVLLQESFAA
ncbi:tryptophanase [Spirosoma linguale]|uniref:Tryptophanase n=1 Tax=Spirosoma linguale (strain ATCC 33905 / DSM 74 / LMG 10896 / Claus 1) TaxID=504472 RepID=D2QI03_SPILD|nr:Tryptophanase [Spirosoma linguale DSM 74]